LRSTFGSINTLSRRGDGSNQLHRKWAPQKPWRTDWRGLTVEVSSTFTTSNGQPLATGSSTVRVATSNGRTSATATTSASSIDPPTSPNNVAGTSLGLGSTSPSVSAPVVAAVQQPAPAATTATGSTARGSGTGMASLALSSLTILSVTTIIGTAETGGLFAEYTSLSTVSIVVPASSLATASIASGVSILRHARCFGIITGKESTLTVSQQINSNFSPVGVSSIQPFPTGSITPGSVSITPTTLASRPSTVPTTPASGNIFSAISYDAPPAQMPLRSDHPVAGVGIANRTRPIETNKFYGNLLIGTQQQPAFPYPFQVRWLKGTGSIGAYGLAIAHDVKKDMVFGPGTPASCKWS
jgi:hypothetical protein